MPVKQTKEISELKLCDRVVRRYVARWKGGGCSTIPSLKKPSGRHRKTSKHVDNVLEREIEKEPRISACKIKENNTDLFSELSVLTVSRRVHELEWDDAEWLDVLWSDEAMFTVTEGRSGHVYQKMAVIPWTPATFVGLQNTPVH